MQNVTEQTWPSVRFMKGARWRASSYRPAKIAPVSEYCVCVSCDTNMCANSHIVSCQVECYENECDVPHCSIHLEPANREQCCNHGIMNALPCVCGASPLGSCGVVVVIMIAIL